MSKVVLLSNQFSVVVKGIERQLINLKYDVKLLENGFRGISTKEYEADAILIYLQESLLDDIMKVKELASLCEKIESNSCGVVLIDSNKDHSRFLKVAPNLNRYTWLNFPFEQDTLSKDIQNAKDKALNRFPKKKILVIDDDTVYGKMVSDWLKNKYTVFAVTDGKAAMEYLSETPVDLVLLDYEMPEEDGPQVLEKLRSNPKTGYTPVMFLTGIGDRESIQRVLQFKPEGYILKSGTKDEILKMLEDFFKNYM